MVKSSKVIIFIMFITTIAQLTLGLVGVQLDKSFVVQENQNVGDVLIFSNQEITINNIVHIDEEYHLKIDYSNINELVSNKIKISFYSTQRSDVVKEIELSESLELVISDAEYSKLFGQAEYLKIVIKDSESFESIDVILYPELFIEYDDIYDFNEPDKSESEMYSELKYFNYLISQNELLSQYYIPVELDKKTDKQHDIFKKQMLLAEVKYSRLITTFKEFETSGILTHFGKYAALNEDENIIYKEMINILEGENTDVYSIEKYAILEESLKLFDSNLPLMNTDLEKMLLQMEIINPGWIEENTELSDLEYFEVLWQKNINEEK